MRKSILYLFLLNCGCLFPQCQDFIVYNNFSKLNQDEYFYSSERMIKEEGDNYRFIVYKNNTTEKIFEFKNSYSLILFNDRKKFLLFLNPNTYTSDEGAPLYFIDGDNGTIEYLGLFHNGFFVLEDDLVIVGSILKRSAFSPTDDLFVYSIKDREIIGIYDANNYLNTTINCEDQDGFFLSFPDYRDGKNVVLNGHIRVYFDHWGQDGPKSFYTYLNVQDVHNIFLEGID